MVLADTSIWIEHLKNNHPHLVRLLEQDLVLIHPAIIGELACGNLHRRAQILDHLKMMRPASVATDDETLAFIEANRINGKGIGWIDAQLLASARLSNIKLWTRDKRLEQLALQLKIHFTPNART